MSFGIIDESGRFSPRPIGTVRDLIEAARAGKIVAFHPRRVQGSLVDYMAELCIIYGFRWNPTLNGYSARYMSRYDGKIYLIVIESAKTLKDLPN